jgi:hypothetical protein
MLYNTSRAGIRLAARTAARSASWPSFVSMNATPILEITPPSDACQDSGTTQTGTVAPYNKRLATLPSRPPPASALRLPPTMTAAASTSSARSARPRAADVEATRR